MPGPQPKHASTRARRNKTSTAATLRAVPSLEVPVLPDVEGGWHEQTVVWWADVWASPMAPEFDTSDRHGLFILATLVNEFWVKPSSALAAEIRLQRQCFGLTPIDRRRLQWEIERTEDAVDKGSRRRAARAPAVKAGEDPRQVLRAV